MMEQHERIIIAGMLGLRQWAKCPICRAAQEGIVEVDGKLYATLHLRVMVFVCTNPKCGKTVHWGVREPEGKKVES